VDTAELLLMVAKLLLGGVTAFLAILLWAKIGNGVCIAFLIAGLTNYVGIVIETLAGVDIIAFDVPAVLGIPLGSLVFTVVPFIFYIIAFVMILVQLKRSAQT
jgi:hypothetical protein